MVDGDDVEVPDLGRRMTPRRGGVAEQHLVDADLDRPRSMPTPVVALPCGSRSTIRTRALVGQAGAEVHRRGRLADAALLVGERENHRELGMSTSISRTGRVRDMV